MNISITPNTTPIDAGVLTPVAKSFSSGGGGSSSTNIYPANINVASAEAPLPVPVPAGTEVTVHSFNMPFVGGKPALIEFFLTLTAAFSAGLSYRYEFYVNGVKVSQTSGAALGNLHWGVLVNPSPAGSVPVAVKAVNTGGMDFSSESSAIVVQEFL